MSLLFPNDLWSEPEGRTAPNTIVTVLLMGALNWAGVLGAQAQKIVATVDSTESVIEYTGSAPMHNWTGTSRDVSGTFVLNPDHADSSRAVIRVPVASFDSGNDRRDRKMREVTEAEQHPLVRFRGTEIQPLRWGRSSDGKAGQWEAVGTLGFHGKTHPVDATVRVHTGPDSVYARAQFPISLTRFEVERPSILWASIGDTIRIDARIVGAIEEPSSAARREGSSQSAWSGGPQGARDTPRDANNSGSAIWSLRPVRSPVKTAPTGAP